MADNPFTQTAPASITCPHCGAVILENGPSGRPERCPQCTRELPKKGELSPRAIKGFGLALIAIGAGLVYWFDYEPWQKIQEGAPEVTLSLKGSACGPLALALGLACFLPNRPAAGGPEPFGLRLLRGALLTLMLLGSIGGVVVYFWLRSYARSHGYDI